MFMNNKVRLFELMNRVSGMPLNEIDWETEYSDVDKTCMNPNELKEYLNSVLANHELPSSKRTKSDLLIHNKAIPFDEQGEIDVASFIKNITQIPPEIISSNGKMEKTSAGDRVTYNIGVPALRGLVYDIDNTTFYVVNTCPGAGTCVPVCYARKGNYVTLTNVFVKQTRVLNLLLNDSDLFQKLLLNELERVCLENRGKSVFFRWDDAGDFFTKRYFEIALNITKKLKAMGYNFESYAYTKMGDIFNTNDPDFLMSFSTDASAIERGKVDLEKSKTGSIVPKILFGDLFSRKGPHFDVDANGNLMPLNTNSIDTLKQRLSDKYKVPIDTILTYNEMLNIPEGGDKKWSVIVTTKDGDISAQRKDVLKTLLLVH